MELHLAMTACPVLVYTNDGLKHVLHLSVQKMDQSMYVVGTRTDSWVFLLRRWILQHFLRFAICQIKSSSCLVAGTTPWHCLSLLVCLYGAQILLVNSVNLKCRSKAVIRCSCLLRYLVCNKHCMQLHYLKNHHGTLFCTRSCCLSPHQLFNQNSRHFNIYNEWLLWRPFLLILFPARVYNREGGRVSYSSIPQCSSP